MILPLFRMLACLRILREDRDRYRNMLRGGALGDSDMPWPPADEAARSDGETHEGGEDAPQRRTR